jgi:hypothetical protein
MNADLNCAVLPSTTASPGPRDHRPQPRLRIIRGRNPDDPVGKSQCHPQLEGYDHGSFAGLGLNYSFCGSITLQPIGPGVRLVSREVAVLGADGQVYFTWVDRVLAESPREINGGLSGCFGSMSDPVVGRPVASTFVAKVGYRSGGRTGVAEFSGPVVRIP